jgi:hypothetical protein
VTVYPPPTATCLVINAVQGVPVNVGPMVGAGGTGAPYTFSATGLPAGLTMSSAGVITGTPTVSGPFTYSVTVKDKDNNVGTVNCSVTVYPPPTATCLVINAVQNVAFSAGPMTGSGGTGGTYTFQKLSGPSWLNVSSTGIVSGTPTATGSFSYSVQVTDKNGHTGTINCSLTVYPPVTATCVTITAIRGVTITPLTMTATGGAGGPYTFSATGLPAGLTMSTSGTISGTPTVSGTFNYTITVKDKNGNAGTVNCSVTVSSPPVCAPTAIDLTGNTSTTGTSGNIRTFTASNGINVNASGWSRDKSTGAWSRAYLGSYPLGLGVTDSTESGIDPTHRVDNVGSQVNYVLFEFSSPVIVTRAYLDAIGADSDITVWVGTASNPFANHLTLSDSVISSFGSPEQNSTTLSTARWASFNGAFVSGNVLVIAASTTDWTKYDEFKITKIELNCPSTPEKPTASCVAINAIQGVAMTPVTLTGSGGAGAPYTFTVTGLPSGLTMSSSGTISGTPTVTGTFTYTVTVKDKNGVAGTLSCSLTVSVGPVCAPSTFDLTGNTATTGTIGNIRLFTASSGMKVKASGWSRDKSTGAWANAYLGSYPAGLGVTDTSESGADPTHKVDNIGSRVNYVQFEFSAPVIVNRAYLDAIGADSDISVWIGMKTDPFNNHLTLSDSLLSSQGTFEENLTSVSTARWADINSGNVQGNVVVIAALASDTTAEDEFKISKLETLCLTPGGYKTFTFTQGGWGAPPNGSNPGALLSTNFTKVYYGGYVTIGGTYKLTFTSASAIMNFLPQGGTAGKLTSNATNPAISSAGVLAGQVLALQLNVDFSNKGVLPAGLANLKVAYGPAAGLTVAQVLSSANAILGGDALPSGFTYSGVVDILDSINKAFDSGTINTGYLK